VNPAIDVPSVAAGAGVLADGTGAGLTISPILSQGKPLPVTHLEGGIVPQRTLGGRRQAKLRGQLPEAPRDARELIGDCLMPDTPRAARKIFHDPASCRHVARHGGLGDAETEHQMFTMDPRRTPQKVLAGHPYDQMSDFAGNPRAPAAPATPSSISPKR
jgi:hypothetical protein